MPVIRRTKKSMVNGVLFKIIGMFRHCAFWTNWSPLPIMIKTYGKLILLGSRREQFLLE